MALTELSRSVSRSDQRIPTLRSRGRANRVKLLAQAQRMIEQNEALPLRFSDVFAAAGVSRGSAYRIYDGIEDLMLDLASTWIDQFVGYLRPAMSAEGIDSWMELSDLLLAKCAGYWHEMEWTARAIPRLQSNAPESYLRAMKNLTAALIEVFDSRFVLPSSQRWSAVLTVYFRLADLIFADAVHREGHISEQRLREAQAICRTYMSTYCPPRLPLRQSTR